MNNLNDKQLSERIDRFIGRKTEEFPELRYIGASPNEQRPSRVSGATPYTIHHTLPQWHLTQVTH